MVFSSTGIAYLLLFLALVFLNYRFFQCWAQNKTTTSKLFFFLALSFFLFALVRVTSVLFFADNLKVLNNSIIAISFIQGLAASIVAYLIIHLKFPKISPWVGFIVIFLLGIIVTTLTIGISYQPSVQESGAIDWGFPISNIGILYSIIRLGVLSITFFPLIIILVQQFLTSESQLVRKRSFGLSLVFFIAIVVGLIDFILTNLFKLDAIYRDMALIAMSIILFIIVFITQKPSYQLE